MKVYVKGPPPDRWQWTKDYDHFPKWHWNTNCTKYPNNVIRKRSSRPDSDLCSECLELEKKALILRELARHRKAKEIMSRNIFTIDPEESIAKAARIMGQNHIGSLIVMSYKTPVGIVTERDLLSKVLVLGKDLKKVKVADVMSYPLMTLCSTVEIKETAKMMMEKKSRLAVFDCGTLVGIITSSDLIKSLPEAPETEAIVDDFMTKKVETLDEKKSIAAAIEVMGKKRIGSVIVTTKGEPIGIFTERDLLSTFLASGKPLTADLIKGTKSPLITATSGISVHEAAVIMTMKHIRRLPITKKAKLAGIITARDLVEAYAK